MNSNKSCGLLFALMLLIHTAPAYGRNVTDKKLGLIGFACIASGAIIGAVLKTSYDKNETKKEFDKKADKFLPNADCILFEGPVDEQSLKAAATAVKNYAGGDENLQELIEVIVRDAQKDLRIEKILKCKKSHDEGSQEIERIRQSIMVKLLPLLDQAEIASQKRAAIEKLKKELEGSIEKYKQNKEIQRNNQGKEEPVPFTGLQKKLEEESDEQAEKESFDSE